MKRAPSGFTATCQCGVTVGALDAKRTDRADMGKLLGQWLFHGCTVTPFFGDTNCFSIGVCRCTEDQPHE